MEERIIKVIEVVGKKLIDDENDISLYKWEIADLKNKLEAAEKRIAELTAVQAPDKTAIKKAIKDGVQLSGAHIEKQE